MKEINWGFIGCGDVTEKKSGPAFNEVAGSKIVAVMSRSENKARSYAERHHVPKWYTDAQQLIDDPDVNAIYVAMEDLVWLRDYRFKKESQLLAATKMTVTVINSGTQHNVVPD